MDTDTQAVIDQNAEQYLRRGKAAARNQPGEIVHDASTGQDLMRTAGSPTMFNPLPADPHERAEAVRQAENYRDGVPYIRAEKPGTAPGQPAAIAAILASAKVKPIDAKDLETLRTVQARVDAFDAKIAEFNHVTAEKVHFETAAAFHANPDDPEAWDAMFALPVTPELLKTQWAWVNEQLREARKRYCRETLCPAVVPILEKVREAVDTTRAKVIDSETATANSLGVAFEPSASIRAVSAALDQLDRTISVYERGTAPTTPRYALKGIVEI